MRTLAAIILCASPFAHESSPPAKTFERLMATAIRAHDSHSVSRLIKKGVSPNGSYSGRTFLSIGIASHSSAAVRILLRAGANPNAPTKLHLSPLGMATNEDWIRMMAILLRAGASLRARVGESENALFAARSVSAAKLLLDWGADIKARDQEQRSVVQVWSSISNPDLVALAIRSGALPNSFDKRHESPLIWLTRQARVDHDLRDPNFYFDFHAHGYKHAPKFATARAKDARKRYSLDLASARILVAHGANPMAASAGGDSALGLARNWGLTELLSIYRRKLASSGRDDGPAGVRHGTWMILDSPGRS